MKNWFLKVVPVLTKFLTSLHLVGWCLPDLQILRRRTWVIPVASALVRPGLRISCDLDRNQNIFGLNLVPGDEGGQRQEAHQSHGNHHRPGCAVLHDPDNLGGNGP